MKASTVVPPLFTNVAVLVRSHKRSGAGVLSKKKKLHGQLLSFVGCGALLLGYIITSFFYMSNVSFVSQRGSEECICWYKNTSYDFCYHLPRNGKIRGRRISCEYAEYLEEFDLLTHMQTVDMGSSDMPTPAFVTAFSENHYLEGLTLIANVRGVWPQQKIIVYDLGLNASSAEDVKSKCFVELRPFPFDRYPLYVRNLKEYRWKPLIIAMVLKEFGAVWYMDASVRWMSDSRDVVYNEVTCRRNYWSRNLSIPKDGNDTNTNCDKAAIMMHSRASHSIFAATDPGTYAYIPTDIEAIKEHKCGCLQATFIFAVKTTDATELLKWFVLCALEKDCMAPPGAQLKCSFARHDRYNVYANCHRYDQSVINLLLANAYECNATRFLSRLGGGHAIVRAPSPNLSEKNFTCALH